MVVNKYIGETVNVDVQFTNTGYSERMFTIAADLTGVDKTGFPTTITAFSGPFPIAPGETLIVNPAPVITDIFAEEQSIDVTARLIDEETLTELDREENPGAVYIKTTISGEIISKTVS